MKQKYKEWFIIIFMLVVGYAFCWGIVMYFLKNHYLSKEAKYTITTKTRNLVRGSRSGTYYFEYTFLVNGKEYIEETESTLKQDLRYFVKFYPPNPKYNEVTSIIATQKDIDSLPPSGYNKLPQN